MSERAAIYARRRALERALLACYELIDRFQTELAELAKKKKEQA